MNTTATWYRGGSTSPWEGRVGFNSGALVGRFAFTTPAIGAATLSWVSSSLLPQDETTWSQTEQAYHFRWAVTLSASEHIGRVSNSIGTAVGTGGWGGTTYMHSGGTAAVQLMPNTAYYLWIFPSDSWYNNWLIGSVSVTLGGSYGMPATPSAADGDFGEAVGISLAGSSSGASFTVSVICAGRTETLQSGGTDTYLTWTPSVAVYAPLLPNAASAPAVIAVETFYGTASIGTRSVSITMRLREEDVSPTVQSGWYSHTPYNETKGSSIARYIAGISRARVSFDTSKISVRYGASIVSYGVSCGGETDSAEPYQTPILTAQSTVTVSVTDSRGFVTSESFQITPFSYAAPSLSQVSVFRCDQSGSADEEGRYYAVAATAVCSSVDGQNAASILLYLKPAAGSYGSGVPLSSGVTAILGPIDADTIYDVKIEITDTVGNTGAVTRRIAGRSWAMRFRANGQGVGFGMAPQADKRLQLPADWSIYVGTDRLLPQAYAATAPTWSTCSA